MKYYEILGLDGTETKDEIITAYETKINEIKKEYNEKTKKLTDNLLNIEDDNIINKINYEVEKLSININKIIEELTDAKTKILNSIMNSTIQLSGKLVTLTNLCTEFKNSSKYFLNNENENNYNSICDKREYEIIKELGKGANNEVFLIKDINNNNTYAFRKLLPEFENDIYTINKELNGLFIQKYLATKCSANICNVIEFGILGDNNTKPNQEIYNKPIYGILEVFNTDLNKYYLENPLSLENYDTYISIFDDILSGLDCIHKENFVHLDIKHANIGLIIDKDNNITVKIADFGTLQSIDNQLEEVYGSTLFIDPIYVTSKEFNYRSDIYSFGIIIYLIYYSNTVFF